MTNKKERTRIRSKNRHDALYFAKKVSLFNKRNKNRK